MLFSRTFLHSQPFESDKKFLEFTGWRSLKTHLFFKNYLFKSSAFLSVFTLLVPGTLYKYRYKEVKGENKFVMLSTLYL